MLFLPIDEYPNYPELPPIPAYTQFRVQLMYGVGFQAELDGPCGWKHYGTADTAEEAMRRAYRSRIFQPYSELNTDKEGLQ